MHDPRAFAQRYSGAGIILCHKFYDLLEVSDGGFRDQDFEVHRGMVSFTKSGNISDCLHRALLLKIRDSSLRSE